MSSTYNINLTDGTPLATIFSLESNGVDNQSTPRRILDIDFSTSPPKFVVGDDVTGRFIPGFIFEVFDSAYAGTYTVDVAGSTYLDGVTSIPVEEPIAIGNYLITGVSDSLDYWKVVSNGNDDNIFYPTSTFTVASNTVPAANIAYTVVSSVSTVSSAIIGVVPGATGSWTINGLHPQTYEIGDQFVVSGTGNGAITGDGTYTISSKTLNASTTTLEVVEPIPPGATVNGGVTAYPNYTKVFVTPGTIPTGATVSGYGLTSTPSQFPLSAPPAVVLAAPNVFDITWRISGDHSARFAINGGFNIKGNSFFNYHTFTTTHVSFSSGMTHITGRITSPVTPTPDSTGFLIHPTAATHVGFIQYIVDPAATSLQLMGKGTPYFNSDTTWGNALLNNAVHQLEHHADDLPPAAPLNGQIWYDKTESQHRTLDLATTHHDIIGVNASSFTIAGNHTTAVELQPGQMIEVYNNTGLGIQTHEYTVDTIVLNTGNTVITVDEVIPGTANISGKLYGRYMWNGMVTTATPVINYVDMAGYPIINVENIPALHEYTTIVGDVFNDNDYQGNALNLRSANEIFVNVSGDTMTGNLVMGTGADINMTDGDINMNAASAINFPVGSTGDIGMNGANSINFPLGSTGGIYLDGNNDLIVTGTGRVDLASNEQRLNGDSFILFTDTSTGDITLAGDNDIIFPATATGDIIVNGANNLLFAGSGRINLANNEQRMNGTSFLNFPVGSTGDITLQGGNDIVFSGAGTINMGNNKITNLADATAATDALNIQTGDARYVNVTGDSMTGALSMTSANITMTGTSTMQFTGSGQVDMGTNKVINLATPTAGTDATNKAYVDAYVSGLVFLTPVKDPNVYNDATSSPPGSPVPYTRTYIVKPAAYTITGRTTGVSGKWIISGNYASTFVGGNTFVVNGNSDGPSNGTYTVASAANVSSTTEITITGTVPAGAGSNGTVYHSVGAWNGKDGRVMSWDGAAWIDVLGRAVQSGDRFGIYMEPDNDEVPIDTSGMGAILIPAAGKIGTIQAAVVSPGFTSLGTAGAWVFYTPVEPDALSVTGNNSQHYGHSYTFRGTYGSGTYNSAHKWIEFSGPTSVIDGAGLKFTGNVLNVGAGTGIIVGADTISVDSAYIATIASTRVLLTANRTYYVRTDGNDSNNGLANTAGGAFLTIQKAIDVICSTLDIAAGVTCTVQIADGTYTGANTVRPLVGAGALAIQGNSSTPANVVISTTSGHCFSASQAVVTIKDLKMQTTTLGWALVSGTGATITYSNINFGACASGHIYTSTGGVVISSTSYAISGGAPVHVQASLLGVWQSTGGTVTITGTPDFSTGFVVASNVAAIYAGGTTYSGSATGKRYDATLNATISSNGGGANFFPGNSAGTTATGGQYA